MDISNVIGLLSGVALFLFGMQLMGDGLKKVAGSKLELVLYKLTSSPFKGLLLGTGVTAIIQSSSATSVMVVGFVNSGMMKVKQAIGIIMGAIIGTSVTGWILCLSDISGGSGWIQLISTETLTGIIAVIGIIFRMASKEQSHIHIGDILLGFSVLMFGMQTMSGSVAPLRESASFIELLTKFKNPILGIIFGMLITCIIQSASASIGIMQALAITGAIDFSIALPVTMGIAIGAALPVLISAIGASTNGRRTAFIYLLIDVLGVIIWGTVFYTVNAIVNFGFMDTVMTTVSIALMNTIFRIATVVVLFPFVGKLEKLVCFLFKDDPDDQELAEIECLEERFIEHPALALEQCRIVVSSMARKCRKNLNRAFKLVNDYSDEGFERIQQKEDIIDKYEDKLGNYLVKIMQKELTNEQNKEISKYLHTINDFERIADHAVNIAESAKEIKDKKAVFSKPAKKELEIIRSAVSAIVDLSIEAMENTSLEAAYRTEPLEELIDGYCCEAKMHHVKRVQKGVCTLNQGFIFNDLLTDYERISDHCSNVAVAVIELAGEAYDPHEYLNELLTNKTESFNKYFEEYKLKFGDM